MLDQACAHCPIFPTAASRRSLGRVSVPVWLIILSDQLTIEALVSLYPTNKLIVRRLLPRRLAPLTHRYHAVLAVVSHGCPPPKDRFLRVTHPSATARLPQPCDLHVLSMPPAFALSQDQTLRFIMQSRTKAEPQSEQRSTPNQTQPNQSEHSVHQHIQKQEYTNKRPNQNTKPSQSAQSKPKHQPNQTSTPIPPVPQNKQKDAANISLPHQIQLSMNNFLSEAPAGRPVGGGGF